VNTTATATATANTKYQTPNTKNKYQHTKNTTPTDNAMLYEQEMPTDGANYTSITFLAVAPSLVFSVSECGANLWTNLAIHFSAEASSMTSPLASPRAIRKSRADVSAMSPRSQRLLRRHNRNMGHEE
jgi:hypothetical protein